MGSHYADHFDLYRCLTGIKVVVLGHVATSQCYRQVLDLCGGSFRGAFAIHNSFPVSRRPVLVPSYLPAGRASCVQSDMPNVPPRDSLVWGGTLQQDLALLITVLPALPSVEDVTAIPLVPGAWCWNMHLWGNPLLP